jgi:uncharacterized protein
MTASGDAHGPGADRESAPKAFARFRTRPLIRWTLVLVTVYAGGCVAVVLVQDKLVFPRQLAPRPTPTVPARAEVLTLELADGGQVPAWFLPARSASPQNPAPAVIFFHGNAEIIDYQDRIPSLYRRLNISVLMPEYRGYGRAAGKPSQEALVADGVRFYEQLVKRPDVDPARVVIHGHSLGGGVAAQVAKRCRPTALILECTFTSVASFAWRYGVPPFLARHPFRTDEVVGDLGVPIFIGHGRRDQIVPVSHGRRLHELVPASTYVELDCGHLDMPGAQPDDSYREDIRRFLVCAGVLPASQPAGEARPMTR